MRRSLKIGAAVLGGLAAVAAAIATFVLMRREMLRAQEGERPVKPPARVVRTPEGETVLWFDAETMRRIELATATLTAGTLAPSLVAYGRLELDPAGSYALRVPVAGTLRSLEGRGDPALGEDLAPGAEVGVLVPRLAFAERVDFGGRLDAARATARLIEASLEPATATALPLRAERGGTVVEVLATPGENLDAGAPVLRLARFDRLLARIELPPGSAIRARLAPARIVAVGFEDHPLEGEPVGFAGAADPLAQAEALLFRVETQGLPLGPGLAVTAEVGARGDALTGVVVPREAVVRRLGRTFAYVEVAEGRFSRREVPLDHPVDGGWFAAAGFGPGERVVTEGGQALLSEELKAELQISAD